ncbi:MAG: DUF2905 family protein [Armatimonadota bacterium]
MERMLILIGIIVVIIGVLLILFGWFGRGLPGDILIRRNGVTIFIPIVTMILLSLILTLILNLLFRR